MQFQKLEFQGFRQFDKKKTILLKPGFNVIIGKNEAGKSTTLEALLSAVFHRRTPVIEPLISWGQETTCETKLTYLLDGKQFSIERDYISQADKLTELKTKKVTQKKDQINQMVAKHFGIVDEKVFKNTTFVAQNQIGIIDDQNTQTKFYDAFLNQTPTEEESFSKIDRKIAKKTKSFEQEKQELEEKLDDLNEKIPQVEQYHEKKKGHQAELEYLDKQLNEKKPRQKQLQAAFEENKTKKALEEKAQELEKKYKGITTQKEELEKEIKELESQPIIQQKAKFSNMDILLAILALILAVTIIGLIVAIPLAIHLYRKHKKPQPNQTNVPTQFIQNKKNKIIELNAEETNARNEFAIAKTQNEQFSAKPFNDEHFYELETLNTEIPSLEKKYSKLCGQVETIAEMNADPVELKEKQEQFDAQLNDLNTKIQAYETATEYLQAAYTELQSQLTPKINKEIGELLQQITSNKYTQVSYNDITDIQIIDPKTKNSIPISQLSQGTKDQIYIAIRIIVAKELAGKPIPLIFDDPFHSFDKDRLENTMNLLKQISKKQQIILVSHDEKYAKYADNVIQV
ncbi:MAG: AAA family ATPase [Candidatus Micrarchaeota archaeon]